MGKNGPKTEMQPNRSLMHSNLNINIKIELGYKLTEVDIVYSFFNTGTLFLYSCCF